jgi:S1-C subfamily serine protease
MTTVDWLIALATVVLAVYGYKRGFLIGAASLLGFAGGAVAGSRLAPSLLASGSRSPYAAMLALAGALIGGGILSRIAEGVAARAGRHLRWSGLHMVDGIAGALLTGSMAVVAAWVAGAALLQAAGPLRLSSGVRSDLERSSILGYLDRQLPPSGSVLDALARVDPLPTMTGPEAHVAKPDPRTVAMTPVRAAGLSVVRVVGDACGLGVEGTGWVAAPDLILTAAHVVAGERATYVQLGQGNGPSMRAQTVLFDSHNDIAVLRVPSLDLAPLNLDPSAATGTAAAILGYPEDGPYRVWAGRLGGTELVPTENTYGKPTLRLISSVRGLIRPGDSGGPVVDVHGRVLAEVFAEVTDAPRGEQEGFAVPGSVLASELAKARSHTAPVSTEGCVA